MGKHRLRSHDLEQDLDRFYQSHCIHFNLWLPFRRNYKHLLLNILISCFFQGEGQVYQITSVV